MSNQINDQLQREKMAFEATRAGQCLAPDPSKFDQGCGNAQSPMREEHPYTLISTARCMASEANELSKRAHLAEEMAYLLAKNPDVARILDLKKELGL